MKKENKKVLTILSFILIVVGLILIMIPIIIEINNKNDKQDNNYNEVLDDDFEDLENEFQEYKNNYMFSLIEDNNTIEFYKYNEDTESYDKIKTYKNAEDYFMVCGEFACLQDFENGYFIFHNEKGLLLYVNVEKDIFVEYDDMNAVYDEKYDQETYIVFKNNKYGLIDLSGEYLYELKASHISFDGVFKENKKYGILDLHTGDVIVPLSQNKIEKLYGLISCDASNGYYRMLNNGKWELYELTTNEKLNDKKYDDIYFIKDNYFFEVNGKKGYIINKSGERLHDMVIPVNFEIDIYYESSINMYENENGDFLEIESYKSPLTDENYEDETNVNLYKFYLKNNQLFKVQ